MHSSTLVGLLLIVAVGGFVWWQKSAQQEIVLPSSNSVQEEMGNTAPSQVADDDSDDDFDDDSDDGMDDNGAASAASADASPASSAASGGISASVVATHATRASCWTSINGSVYDLTSWIPKHPGGEQAILQLCGTDGSAKFNGQHGGAQKQAAILAGFKIGVLMN